MRDPRVARLGDLYPFDSHYLDILGVQMHYLDEGSGPAVVMLHGNPTWSFYYRDLVRGLRDRYRVVVPDHVGCGLSDKPQDYPYTLSRHIDNLGRLIEHLGLRSVTLAGHDWGGAIAFGWAVRNPNRVERFVLFNTAAFFGRIPLRIRMCGWPVLGDVIVRRLNLFARGAIRMASRRGGAMPPGVAGGYLLPYDTYAHRIGVLRFIQDIPLARSALSRDALESIERGLAQFRGCPMVIFWGGRDFCFNDSFLREWIRRFPDAVVHHFPEAGHYVVQDAHKRILPLLREFLGDGVRAAVTPTPQEAGQR